MKDIVLWLFNQISSFVSISMTWKIYGDFSLTHFILGGMFLIALFKLFGFSFENTGNFATSGVTLWKNIENRNDKKNYYNTSLTTKMVNGVKGAYASESHTYRGKTSYKTGEFIPKSHHSSSVVVSDKR